MWGTKKVNSTAATKGTGDGRTNYTQLTQMAYQIPRMGRKIYDDTSEYQMMSRHSRERPKARSSTVQTEYALGFPFSKGEVIAVSQTDEIKRYRLSLLRYNPQPLTVATKVYRKESVYVVGLKCDERSRKAVPKSLWQCAVRGIEERLRVNKQHQRVVIYPFNLMVVCVCPGRDKSQRHLVEIDEHKNILSRVIAEPQGFEDALEDAFGALTTDLKESTRVKFHCVIAENFIPNGVEEVKRR
jgi:hypothetical protein